MRRTGNLLYFLMERTFCPNCGNPKKPWFALCWECSEEEKQKPKCEICGIDIPEGHNLCKTHWKEKQEGTARPRPAWGGCGDSEPSRRGGPARGQGAGTDAVGLGLLAASVALAVVAVVGRGRLPFVAAVLIALANVVSLVVRS